MINKVVQGWINYYTHYYKSEFYEVLRYINQCLIKWVRRSYKKKNTKSRAEHWLGAVARRDRNLFVHWKFGILPSVGEGAVWVERLTYGFDGRFLGSTYFVVTFQYKSDAEWFYEHLKHRMGHFGLSLEEEKSHLIEFGRYAKERCSKAGTKPGTFTFLGFTHYCSKSRNGRFRVKRKTSKKKFAKKCREVNLLLVKMRTCRLKEIIAKLNQILTGYYHYYGITDNTESITAFRYNIMRSLFYCLNRRSQKKSYNWVEFLNMLDNSYPLVRPRIYVNIYEW